MSDPYAELGIERSATHAEVRRAYQRRARRAHPDKGGSREEFQRVSGAYRLLSDPGRRARYDATGAVDHDANDERAEIINAIFSLLLQAVDGGNANPLEVIAAKLRRDIAELNSQCARRAQQIRLRTKALKRLRRKKDGDNLLARMMAVEIEKLTAVNATVPEVVAKIERAIAVVEEYELAMPDEPQQPNGNVYFQFLTA